MIIKFCCLLFTLLLVLPLCAQAAQPDKILGLKADTVRHDFGKIAHGGIYRTAYDFDTMARCSIHLGRDALPQHEIDLFAKAAPQRQEGNHRRARRLYA